MTVTDQLRRALSLFASPAIKEMARAEVAYEQGINELHALIGPPLTVDELKAVVAEVAMQSTHKKREVPAHITFFLLDQWHAENLPELRDSAGALQHVFLDCREGCLVKFLELRGKAVKAEEHA